MIGRSFQVQKDIVRRKVQSALTNVHLSVDIWTSPNNHLLLAVCAHFVDSQDNLTKALLALRPVSGHSGAEQWNALFPVLEEYGIIRKLGAIVADNSTTNDTLCSSIHDHLAQNEAVQWDPIQQRIRCQGHTINLAVKDFLFKDIISLEEVESYERIEVSEDSEEDSDSDSDSEELELEVRSLDCFEEDIDQGEVFRAMGILGKLHNVVVHFRSSPNRTKEFVSLVGRRVPLDNSTRWNSWYQMLSVALEHESGIDAYIKKNLDTLEKDCISAQDWKDLHEICEFLKPFHRATLDTQGANSTLGQVLFTMDVLIKHMESSLVLTLLLAIKSKADIVRQESFTAPKASKPSKPSRSSRSSKPSKASASDGSSRLNEDLAARVENAWVKFDEYYSRTDNSPLYAAALILNPNYRLGYIHAFWKTEWIDSILPKVRQLWKTYCESEACLSSLQRLKGSSIVSNDIVNKPSQRIPQVPDKYDQIVNEMKRKVVRSVSQDEYEDYSSETPFEVEVSSLEWWCQESQTTRWPRLSLFAREVLSIPAMSDEPERVFSGGRRTISWERMQLGVSNLERIECMKSWHRSSILEEDVLSSID